MATSTSRNFVMTCEEITDTAMDLVGALNQGAASVAADKVKNRRLLNLLVQSLSTRNVLQLWTLVERTDLYVSDVLQNTLTASTGSYDLGRDVLDIMSDTVYLRRSGMDHRLLPMSWHEYATEGDKTAEGMPNRFLVQANQTYTDTGNSRVISGRLRLVLLPVPENSTDVLYYTCVRKLQDFDGPNDDPDAPPVWSRCLTYGLASELALKYGMPLAERRDLRGEFEAELERLRNFDTQRGSMSLSPNIGGLFRL